MDDAPCVHVLTRGPRAGSACGRKSCRVHLPSTPAGESAYLPALVRSKVAEAVIQGTHGTRGQEMAVVETLAALSATSTEWREGVADARCWDLLLDRIPPERIDGHGPHMDRYGLTPCQRVHLLMGVGCQKCGAPRVTKIHWPFPVRVCRVCVQEMTVSGYRLAAEYGLDASGLPSFPVDLWNRIAGAYTLRFHLIHDVRRHLTGGRTLDRYAANMTAALRARAIEAVRAKLVNFPETDLPIEGGALAGLRHPQPLTPAIVDAAAQEVARVHAVARVCQRFGMTRAEADHAVKAFRSLCVAVNKASRSLSLEAIDALPADFMRKATEAKERADAKARVATADLEARMAVLRTTDDLVAARLGSSGPDWGPEGGEALLKGMKGAPFADFLAAAEARRAVLLARADEAAARRDAQREAETAVVWTCPHCPGSARLFTRGGLADHTRSRHRG